MFMTAYTQFSSKERDAETGLDYFGARYYSGPTGTVYPARINHCWINILKILKAGTSMLMLVITL